MLESMAMIYSGSKLKSIRLERGIALEQVASATKIRLSILQDLEDEEYSELSSSTQANGFLKLYANYLGLSETEEPTATPPSEIKEEEPPIIESNPAQVEHAPVQESVPPQDIARNELDTVGNETPPPEPSPESNSDYQKELEAIGRELVGRRHYLNIPWKTLEEETHIPQDQLRSIERGDLEAFTNPMQFKGLLQSYARFLNLDVEAVMIRFANAIQKRRIERTGKRLKTLKPFKVLPPKFVNIRRFFTLDLFFGTLMIVGILAFLIWGISQMSFAGEKPMTSATLPAVADILLAESTETPIVTTQEIEEDVEEPAAIAVPTATPFYTSSDPEAAVEIFILARQNIWLRIISDGEVAFEGRESAGNVLNFAADESIELQTGNLAGLEIIFNQNPYESETNKIGTAARILFTTTGVSELPLFDPVQTQNP